MDAEGTIPNFRWITVQVREGVNVTVIIEPRGKGIVTAYPVDKIPAYLRGLV